MATLHVLQFCFFSADPGICKFAAFFDLKRDVRSIRVGLGMAGRLASLKINVNFQQAKEQMSLEQDFVVRVPGTAWNRSRRWGIEREGRDKWAIVCVSPIIIIMQWPQFAGLHHLDLPASAAAASDPRRGCREVFGQNLSSTPAVVNEFINITVASHDEDERSISQPRCTLSRSEAVSQLRGCGGRDAVESSPSLEPTLHLQPKRERESRKLRKPPRRGRRQRRRRRGQCQLRGWASAKRE